MPCNVSSRPSLLIVSDTAIWRDGDAFLPFEPVVRELESVGDLFAKVSWIGFDYGYAQSPVSARSVNGLSVNYILLTKVGGETLWEKLVVFFYLPCFFAKIIKAVRQHDVIHSRGPSVPALLMIVLSFFDNKRAYWHKYAGNWSEKGGPVGYRLQRWLLTRLSKPHVRVAINGHWPHLHRGFICLENPCIDEGMRQDTKDFVSARSFSGSLSLCFVGNFDENKGSDRLLRVLLENPARWALARVTIVGGGPLLAKLQFLAQSISYPVTITGAQSRRQVFENVFRAHDLVILPSQSEGFPKVIAEGAAHGCIPIVTRMSSLDQYIRHGENGFLLNDSTEQSIAQGLDQVFFLQSKLRSISVEAWKMSEQFTYERFRHRIANEILASRN